MSPRQLRARLDRLEARFPERDEESIARARYDHLHRRVSRGEMELLTRAEKVEYGELTMSLVVWLPPATTDEERAGRARWNDLRRKRETLEPLTEAEQIEFDELTIRYAFLRDAIKARRDEAKKQRAEGEERSRLQHLRATLRGSMPLAATRLSRHQSDELRDDGRGKAERRIHRWPGGQAPAAAQIGGDARRRACGRTAGTAAAPQSGDAPCSGSGAECSA